MVPLGQGFFLERACLYDGWNGKEWNGVLGYQVTGQGTFPGMGRVWAGFESGLASEGTLETWAEGPGAEGMDGTWVFQARGYGTLRVSHGTQALVLMNFWAWEKERGLGEVLKVLTGRVLKAKNYRCQKMEAEKQQFENLALKKE